MIHISGFDVTKISDLLIYFIPGYIAISVYRLFTSTKSNGANTLWVSCVISYIAVALSGIILPEALVENYAWKAISACIFAIVGSVVFSLLSQSKRVNTTLLKVFHFSSTPTVLSGAITPGGYGSVAIVHIDGLPYYIKGAVAGYSNNSDDPHMSLKYYAFYNPETNEPTYICEDPDRCFVFDVRKAKYLEIWPTTTDDIDESENKPTKKSKRIGKVDNRLWEDLQSEIKMRKRRYISK